MSNKKAAITEKEEKKFKNLSDFPQMPGGYIGGKRRGGGKGGGIGTGGGDGHGKAGGRSKGGKDGDHRGVPGGELPDEVNPSANAMDGPHGKIPGKHPGRTMGKGGDPNKKPHPKAKPFRKKPKHPAPGTGRKDPAVHPGGKAKKTATKPTKSPKPEPEEKPHVDQGPPMPEPAPEPIIPQGPPMAEPDSEKASSAGGAGGIGDSESQDKKKSEALKEVQRSLQDGMGIMDQIRVFPGGANESFVSNEELTKFTKSLFNKTFPEEKYPGDSYRSDRKIADAHWLMTAEFIVRTGDLESDVPDTFALPFAHFKIGENEDEVSKDSLLSNLYQLNGEHSTQSAGYENFFQYSQNIIQLLEGLADDAATLNPETSAAPDLQIFIDFIKEAQFYILKAMNTAVKVDLKNRKINLLKDSYKRMGDEMIIALGDNDEARDLISSINNSLNNPASSGAMLAPRPAIPQSSQNESKQRKIKTMNKNDIRALIKEAFTDKVYGQYPYSHRPGDEEEPKEDYVEEWKKFCLRIIQDKTRANAIELAKVLIDDLELFEDVLDLAGQNQSIGSEILQKMQKTDKNMV